VTAAKIDDATLASLVARIEALEARSAAAARAFGIPEEH
jgi:BMFP domain-containing protein YqiC